MNIKKLSYRNKLSLIIYISICVPLILLIMLLTKFFFTDYENNISDIYNKIEKNERNDYASIVNVTSDKINFLYTFDLLNLMLQKNSYDVFEEDYYNMKNITKILDALFVNFDDDSLKLYTDNDKIYNSKYIEKLTPQMKEELSYYDNPQKIYTRFSKLNNGYGIDFIRLHENYDNQNNIIKITVPIETIYKKYDYDTKYFMVIYDNESNTAIPVNTDDKKSAENIFWNYKNGKKTSYSVKTVDDLAENMVIYNFIDTSAAKFTLFRTVFLCSAFFVFFGLIIIKFINALLNFLTKKLVSITNDITTQGVVLSKNSAENYDEFDIIREKLEEYKIKLMNDKNKILALELKQLSDRISTHFLYNNLNTIRIKSNDNSVRAIIDYLVKYYRQAFKRTQSFVSVKYEVDYLEIYTNLLKYSYETDFIFSTDISLECENVEIPSNIIQPLIENAFIHGINCDNDTTGEIVLKIYKKGNNMVIEVKDSALNADFEKIDDVIKNSETQTSALAIINKRIKLYYGEEYGISYYLKYGYTVICVNMPYNNMGGKQ